MKGSTEITRLEVIDGKIIARVPRTDLIGKQAKNVRNAIMRSLDPDTQRPWGVRVILHMSKETFQTRYIRSWDWKTDDYYQYCKAEALRLEALDAYYYERATMLKELTDLTDAEWDMLDPWDAYILAPEFEHIPFERHRSLIDQLKERVRAKR